MSLQEIADIPIQDFMDKDCAVFLWQNDSLPRATAFLADQWKLRIATDNVLVWIKTDKLMGMGYYTRKQIETVALLVKGSPKRKSKGVRNDIYAPRREHSRKPDETYTRIETLMDGPYLEMFARQRWGGWDVWGWETDKFVSQKSLHG